MAKALDKIDIEFFSKLDKISNAAKISDSDLEKIIAAYTALLGYFTSSDDSRIMRSYFRGRLEVFERMKEGRLHS